MYFWRGTIGNEIRTKNNDKMISKEFPTSFDTIIEDSTANHL